MFCRQVGESCFLVISLSDQKWQDTILWVNKVVWCFDFLHYMTDLVTYFPYGTFFTWWFLHLKNMAYFLLQMSSLGIYLLNCKGRKIIHISVIRHARNTSQNPIRLLIKKGKATVWYYVDLKALPEGFYSLIISVCFFSLFCLWIEHQCEMVYTHNAEQIKNKDDRGKRWIHCSSHPCSFEEIQCSRTHLYNISTPQKKNGYVHVNSLSWPCREDDGDEMFLMQCFLPSEVAESPWGLEKQQRPGCRVRLLLCLAGNKKESSS